MQDIPKYLSRLISASTFIPKTYQSPSAWIGHLPFASWIMKELEPKVFVELGTHTGTSYFSFCQSVQEGDFLSKCYAVDTWQGDEHAGHYDDVIFKEVSKYNSENYAIFSQLLRMRFEEAVDYFSDQSIDLLHIDGLHTYEAVKNDFETWLPKMKQGGVVLFHDTNVREMGFGVWKLFEELIERYPNHLEFTHSYGLGIVEIKEAGASGLEWLKPDSLEKRRLFDVFSALGSKEVERYSLFQLAAENNREIQSLSKDADAHSAHIEALTQEQHATIQALHRDGEEQNATIQALRRDGEEQNATIQALRRDGEEQNSTIQSLLLQTHEQNSTIQSLHCNLTEHKAMLQEQRHKLDSLTAQNKELAKIVDSAKKWQQRGWFKRAFHKWRTGN